jgi:hypothetical protein
MSDRSMLEWLKPDSLQKAGLTVALATPIFATLVKDAVDHVTWSTPTQAIVSGVLALTLATAAANAPLTPVAPRFRLTVFIIAAAYALIALLYLIKVLKLFTPPNGYDAVTDTAGTLVFVGAWLCLPSAVDDEARRADRMLMIVVALGIFLSGGIKIALQVKGIATVEELGAARLMLNLCNGAALLGLYGTMRRTQRPPDPFTHTLILFFGCTQVAAQGSDCLTGPGACAIDSVSGLAAYTIAWILLLGKIAFAGYVAFCYFNPPSEAVEDGAETPSSTPATI